MLKNYLLVAFRNLRKHRLFSFINILCLSLGITFSLLIGMYILQQRNINADLRHSENQYVLKSNWKVKNMGLDITSVGPLPKALRENYPSLVANYYRYNPVTNVVSANNNYFKEDIAIGDTGFIRMYGFPLVHGDANKPFRDVNSAVITESLAIKLFGKTDVIGQRVSLQTLSNAKQDYLVSAVLKDLRYNSVTGLIDSKYDMFVPTEGSRYYGGGDPSVNWNDAYEVCFVELQPGIPSSALRQPIRDLLVKNAPDRIHKNLEVELAPVRSYYLKDNNNAAGKMIRILALIGLFIVLMAIINFVNISIGTSSYRLKEIGLRKVLGGKKQQLVFQFLCESLLLALLAGVISLFGYIFLRPVFNELLNTTLPRLDEFKPYQAGLFAGLILVVGLLAGLYPSWVLSGTRIVFSVKGKMESVYSGTIIRKSLLVLQFTLTIMVFIGALTVSRQVSHIFSKDLGYNREQLLVLSAFPKQWDTVGVQRMTMIKQQLLQVPSVKSVSLTFEVPDRKPPATIPLLPVNGGTEALNIPSISVDEDYADALGLTVVSGRFFNVGRENFVPGQVVINESAARSLGIDPRTGVGTQLKLPAAIGGQVTVSGIVQDYNYSNVEEGIEPILFMHVKDALSYRYLAVRLRGGDNHANLASLREAWKNAAPNSPFEYLFMEDKFASLYQAQLQLKKAANVATVLTLVIVLLGLFGVIAFTLAKRNKEIAVRKVLGAGTTGIIRLFLQEYGVAIVLANVIAWPLAYWFLDNWLQQYHYRVEQQVFSYLLAGVLVLLFAAIMIVLQCFRTAAANPVKSLRTE